jgi:hypothetical protein
MKNSVTPARRVHTRFQIAVASIFGSQGADALIITKLNPFHFIIMNALLIQSNKLLSV